MMFFFIVLGFCVVAAGIAYQFGLSNKSNEEVVPSAIGSSSKLSQKPSTDVNTANSPSYATSPGDEPSKDVSTARVHATTQRDEPSKDVSTARVHASSSSDVKGSEAPLPNKLLSVGNEQQPSNDVKTATSPKVEEDQTSTAASASSTSASTGGSDDDKKAKKKKKKHKKGHKHKKSKGSKESNKRDKGSSSADQDVAKKSGG